MCFDGCIHDGGVCGSAVATLDAFRCVEKIAELVDEIRSCSEVHLCVVFRVEAACSVEVGDIVQHREVVRDGSSVCGQQFSCRVAAWNGVLLRIEVCAEVDNSDGITEACFDVRVGLRSNVDSIDFERV